MVEFSLSICTLYITSVIFEDHLLSSQFFHNERLGDKNHSISNHHFRHKLKIAYITIILNLFRININQSTNNRGLSNANDQVKEYYIS